MQNDSSEMPTEGERPARCAPRLLRGRSPTPAPSCRCSCHRSPPCFGACATCRVAIESLSGARRRSCSVGRCCSCGHPDDPSNGAASRRSPSSWSVALSSPKWSERLLACGFVAFHVTHTSIVYARHYGRHATVDGIFHSGTASSSLAGH